MPKHLPGVSSFVLLVTLIALVPSDAPAQQATGTQLVILVRHAEKASCKGDSVLSKAGKMRAEALVRALEHTRVKHIITSDAKRTQETAAPLAEKFGIKHLTTIDNGNNPDHVQQVVKAVISQRSDTVVVVGHGDSVPEIINELHGTKLSHLPGNNYSALFVVTRGPDGTQFVRARYGAADPGEEC